MQKQTDERCNYSWRSVVSGNMFMVLQGQTRFDFVRTVSTLQKLSLAKKRIQLGSITTGYSRRPLLAYLQIVPLHGRRV